MAIALTFSMNTSCFIITGLFERLDVGEVVGKGFERNCGGEGDRTKRN